MAAGVAHIPWYATLFRGDEFADALTEIAPIAHRYGATSWAVHRSFEDAYKFLHMIGFEDKRDWELFWHGEEMQRFRAEYSGSHHQLVNYSWNTVVVEGPAAPAPAGTAASGAN